ncbi:MAG: class IV adenylate cyclase [Patescibacteria group bacterium]|jgi:predicted adenylyl cyclase CyaB
MEIEIKAKAKDFKLIRRRLKILGAKKIKKLHQIDFYYSLYKRPLNKKTGSIVRVRHNVEEKMVTLEYDTAFNDVAAEEIELTVNSLPVTLKLLEKMKAIKEVVVDKQREYYKKDDLEIVLDKVKGLGNYMEVEIQGRNTEANRQRIVDFYKRIGIGTKDFILGPRYNSMLMKKKGRTKFYF